MIAGINNGLDVIFLTPKRQDVPVVEEGKPAKLCPWCGRSLNHD